MVASLRARRHQHFVGLTPQPEPLLLDAAGPLAGRSVLVLGHDTATTMDHLMLSGCLDADVLVPSIRFVSGWLGSGGADVVLVPTLARGSEAMIVAQATKVFRRSGGLIALRFARVDRDRARMVRTSLLEAGYQAVAEQVRGAERVVTGRRPSTVQPYLHVGHA